MLNFHFQWWAQPVYSHNSPGQNTGVANHSLLQRIFLTQGSNQGHLHCGWILYHLSRQGAQEHGSGEPVPSPGDLPDPEIRLGSPALQPRRALHQLNHQGALFTVSVLILGWSVCWVTGVRLTAAVRLLWMGGHCRAARVGSWFSWVKQGSPLQASFPSVACAFHWCQLLYQ